MNYETKNKSLKNSKATLTGRYSDLWLGPLKQFEPQLSSSSHKVKEFTQDIQLSNQKEPPPTPTYRLPHKARHHPAAVCDRRCSARRVLCVGRGGGRGWLCGAAVCVSRTVVTDAATRIKAKESNTAAALFHHFCLHKYLFSLVSAKNNPVTPDCCLSDAHTHVWRHSGKNVILLSISTCC